MKTNRSPKLDQLTSLRFIAAAMIIILHCAGKWGVSTDQYRPLALGQGVSFFFVLSGFILSYVYPEIATFLDAIRFMRARIARIWPMHVFTLCAAAVLPFALKFDWHIFLLNLFLFHDWIPKRSDIFSFNAPSWTISAELFFYLSFPLIIVRRYRVTFAFAAAVIIILFLLNLESRATDPLVRATLQDVIEFHPISRISEFILGMWICARFRPGSAVNPPSVAVSTVFEFAAFALCFMAMHFTVDLVDILRSQSSLGNSCAAWVEQSGSMLAFAVLIYVMAIGRGAISRVLSAPPFVLLGELSFSMYLLHQLILRFYEQNQAQFPTLSNGLGLSAFWAVILALSAAALFGIEKPMRRLILS